MHAMLIALLLATLTVQGCFGGRNPTVVAGPTPRVHICQPKGLRVCITDESGMTAFEFNANINRRIGVERRGTYGGQVDAPKAGGRWCYEDPDAVLGVGDVLHYWYARRVSGRRLRSNGTKTIEASDVIIDDTLFEPATGSTKPHHSSVETPAQSASDSNTTVRGNPMLTGLENLLNMTRSRSGGGYMKQFQPVTPKVKLDGDDEVMYDPLIIGGAISSTTTQRTTVENPSDCAASELLVKQYDEVRLRATELAESLADAQKHLDQAQKERTLLYEWYATRNENKTNTLVLRSRGGSVPATETATFIVDLIRDRTDVAWDCRVDAVKLIGPRQVNFDVNTYGQKLRILLAWQTKDTGSKFTIDDYDYDMDMDLRLLSTVAKGDNVSTASEEKV